MITRPWTSTSWRVSGGFSDNYLTKEWCTGRTGSSPTALSWPHHCPIFEAALNYKEVSDPSVIVQFKRLDKDDAWILAWTTTPWTLPSNLALCVHPTLTYLRVKKKEDNQEWIVGKDRWQWVCSSIKKGPDDFEVLEELPGERNLLGYHMNLCSITSRARR